MNSKQYLKSKNLRKQKPDEIIIDIDDRTENGVKCYMASGINLVKAGYWIEVWYADGMKEPHIHIKNIGELSSLTQEEGTLFRKLFLAKFIPKEFWNDKIPDFSLCEKYEDKFHPIAEENKPHYKYKTIKTLRSEFNKSYQNALDLEIYEKVKTTQTTNSRYTLQEKNLVGNVPLYKKIANKISICYIADEFGLSPTGKRMRECPFHADSNPSLSLNEQEGIFRCFGCHVSGNIIKFYAMLKKLNPRFKLKVSQ